MYNDFEIKILVYIICKYNSIVKKKNLIYHFCYSVKQLKIFEKLFVIKINQNQL